MPAMQKGAPTPAEQKRNLLRDLSGVQVRGRRRRQATLTQASTMEKILETLAKLRALGVTEHNPDVGAELLRSLNP